MLQAQLQAQQQEFEQTMVERQDKRSEELIRAPQQFQMTMQPTMMTFQGTLMANLSGEGGNRKRRKDSSDDTDDWAYENCSASFVKLEIEVHYNLLVCYNQR